jgi:hypothetical protein
MTMTMTSSATVKALVARPMVTTSRASRSPGSCITADKRKPGARPKNGRGIDGAGPPVSVAYEDVPAPPMPLRLVPSQAWINRSN